MSENDTIVLLLSGPAAYRNQVVAACRQAGLQLFDGDPKHSWGLPDTTGGEEDPTISWVTLEGHPDRFPADPNTQELLGWVLRAHWPKPPPAPALEVVPAGTLDRLDRIERILAERGEA